MIKLGRAYLHNKSGREVITQGFATLRINESKFKAVIYNDKQLDLHVRTVDDFLGSCKLIE